MRKITLDPDSARLLGRLQAAARAGHPKLCHQSSRTISSECRVRLQDLERVEKEIGMIVPDRIIAYLAAGVSLWGDGPVNVGSLIERTLGVRDIQEDFEEGPPKPFAVVDDDSNGNYIAVVAGTRRDSDAVHFLDHETGYVPNELVLSLYEEIERRLGKSEQDAPPVTLELYDEPDPEPEVVWVVHPKFGRGRVLEHVGDNVTVAFDAVGQKRLKERFLSFE